MKLPKIAYVVVKKETEEYMLVTETLEEHAEIGQKIKVGIYHLDEIVELTTALHTDKIKK